MARVAANYSALYGSGSIVLCAGCSATLNITEDVELNGVGVVLLAGSHLTITTGNVRNVTVTLRGKSCVLSVVDSAVLDVTTPMVVSASQSGRFLTSGVVKLTGHVIIDAVMSVSCSGRVIVTAGSTVTVSDHSQWLSGSAFTVSSNAPVEFCSWGHIPSYQVSSIAAPGSAVVSACGSDVSVYGSGWVRDLRVAGRKFHCGSASVGNQ